MFSGTVDAGVVGNNCGPLEEFDLWRRTRAMAGACGTSSSSSMWEILEFCIICAFMASACGSGAFDMVRTKVKPRVTARVRWGIHCLLQRQKRQQLVQINELTALMVSFDIIFHRNQCRHQWCSGSTFNTALRTPRPMDKKPNATKSQQLMRSRAVRRSIRDDANAAPAGKMKNTDVRATAPTKLNTVATLVTMQAMKQQNTNGMMVSAANCLFDVGVSP